jgi:hypothetical protein
MENVPSEIRPLSTPSGYRQLNPAVLPLAPFSERARTSRRRRLMIGFGIAAALHVGLVLAWWLTPPLRLKASYAPERWVQVLPVAPTPAPPAVAPPSMAPPMAPVKPDGTSAAIRTKKNSPKSHKSFLPSERPSEPR